MSQSTTFHRRHDRVTGRVVNSGVSNKAGMWKFGATMRKQATEDDPPDRQAEWTSKRSLAKRSSARGTVAGLGLKRQGPDANQLQAQGNKRATTTAFCSAGVCHRCALDRARRRIQWRRCAASHTSTVACVTDARDAFVGADGGTGEPTAWR